MKKYTLPSIHQQTETVILANGEFPSGPIALDVLNNAKYFVCCDGAINNLVKTDRVPDAIVGDCDSLSKQNTERFANIIHRIAEQETNDLTKAVHFCLQQGRNKITILGATGKREDHTIGNVSLLCEYMRENADVEMITDYGTFVSIEKTSLFESKKGQQMSLFCIDKCLITSQHLKYAITNQIFTNWWQATLNESDGDEFIIETDGRVIVYRAF